MSITKPSPAEVKALFVTPLSDDTVQVYIDDAALVLERVPSVVSAAAPLQAAITRWVTMHMLLLSSSGALTSETMGDASKAYASSAMGAGLSSTVYGQRALLLDPNLVNVGKTRAFFVVT